ncbi:hypothetical protein C0416_04265 [bacterium]|nr:hypothetical protein [bacterium]
MKMKPKIKIKFILAAALILVLVLPLTASAQSSGVTSQLSGVFSGTLGSLSEVLTIILKVLQRVLWPIFLAIGGLLNNDLLFGYGMEQRLLDVWVQMRNYVNILFVVLLLGVALFNVLGLKPDSEYALKPFLTKFVIALIAVNFSYVAVKVVLDVTNVMTIAVFALPASIGEGVSPQIVTCPPEGGPCVVNTKATATVDKICKTYYGTTLEFKKTSNDLEQKDPEADQNFLCEDKSGTYALSESGMKFFTKFNSRNAALLMAIQFMNVLDVDKISSSISNDKMDVGGLAFNLLFSVILYVIYGAAYVALFVVLLARLVFLWLIIALSPFAVLAFVAPNLVPSAAGSIQEKFVKNVFAPILIGIPLTIGYVLLEALRMADVSDKAGLATSFSVIKLETSGISDLQSMIIAFAAVAVVWVGVFMAAEGTIAARFTEAIKQTVGGFGMKAVEGLKTIPLIPAGEGGKRISYNKAFNLEPKDSGGGEKTTTSELKEMALRPKEFDIEKLRSGIRTGLGTTALPEDRIATFKLLKNMEGLKAEPKKQRLAQSVIRELGPDEMEGLKKGKKLAVGKQSTLMNKPYLQLDSGVAPPRTPLPPAGTVPKQPAPKSTNDMGVALAGEELGIASPELKTASGELTNANNSGNADRIKAAETKFNELKPEIDTIKKVVKADAEIGDVKKFASTDLSKLKAAVATADKALQTNGIGDAAKRKEILGKILEKAKPGIKAADYLS